MAIQFLGMGHRVEDIIRRASAENWCCEPFCTTCRCMQFRTAIRDLPPNIVSEFFQSDPTPDLQLLPNYAKFVLLILFHQLPRTESERSEAQRQIARAFEQWEKAGC